MSTASTTASRFGAGVTFFASNAGRPDNHREEVQVLEPLRVNLDAKGTPGAVADRLFDTRWEQGRRTLARHGPDRLWLERSEDTDVPTGPAPLDFNGLDNLVG